MMTAAPSKVTARIPLALSILLVMAASAFAQLITSKDAAFYLADPGKWDGKKITIMVTSCYLDGTSKDKKTTEIEVYTSNGSMIANVPSEKAKAFMRRYTGQYYGQRRILVGIFDAESKSIAVEDESK